MAFNGDYFYVSSNFGQSYFKLDRQTGKLTYVDGVFNGRNKRGKLIAGSYAICFAGGRMYKVAEDSKGMTWCDIEAQTGKPIEKGRVDCPAAAGRMIVAPDQKSLYLKAGGEEEGHLLWYRINADGKPAKAGDVTGKGIGFSEANCDFPWLSQMSADGKFLYTISSQDYAIACIERKANGEIACKSTIDLDTVIKRESGYERFRWVALAISPNDKWLYASVRNGRPSANYYAIFKRDAETGALSLKETITGDKDPLANLRGWAVTFSPDGSGGYLGCCTGPFLTFKYDARTGHLTDLGMVKGTKAHGIGHLAWDPDRRFLYAGSYDGDLFPGYGFGIYVLKNGN
jgi:6-phosphogluconolactonase (cycloisomerase 2 family)